MNARNQTGSEALDIEKLMSKVETGFESQKVGDQYKDAAKKYIREWLTDPACEPYRPQLVHLITSGAWDYLLDSFYQIIPFGTGGRRGEVGIGPNRINPWTIRASAQGHSQYLKKQYGDDAGSRGIVLAFDVRQFFSNRFFDDALPNPVRNLNCRDLAVAALEVYAANGIKVSMFDGVRTTPELSFAIRHLHAVAGAMFSASHNPPEHNGKKVFDEFGGQLIPPDDEALVNEVTQQVTSIKSISYDDAEKAGLVSVIGPAVDDAYIKACTAVSLSTARDISIVYSPLHGCGMTNAFRALKTLGFNVQADPATSNLSGKFEHVTFNIPNPEVVESFTTTLEYAKKVNADIVLSSDPDSDRIGIVVHHHDDWKYLNGNEIAVILTAYAIGKRRPSMKPDQGIIIKTEVTTNAMTEICRKNQVTMIGNLLVGYKYIGAEMNRLDTEGLMGNFLMACEESHGYVAGNYIREKDSAVPAIWLAELAAELKKEGKTLVDYLDETYATYGYFRNYLTEIRLPGAEGMSQIKKIQDTLRTAAPKSFGRFMVTGCVDWQTHLPIVSETDRISKNMLIFSFEPLPDTISIRVTVRPSGTEPKTKFYFEIGTKPYPVAETTTTRAKAEELVKELERAMLDHCYAILGVQFPARGYLLFWQLPLVDKMRYFEVEDEIAALRELPDVKERTSKFAELTGFLGSDPIEKIDAAFTAKYGSSVRKHLSLL